MTGLLRLWADAEVARLASLRLRQQLAAGQPGPEGSAAKVTFARLNQEISGFDVELAGADGLRYGDWSMRRPAHAEFLGRDPGFRYLRAKGNSIEGGTSEVLRNIIAERVLGLPSEPRVDKDVPMEGPAPMTTTADLEGAEQAAADRTPDLLYSETETELRDSVRSLLARRCKPEDVLARADGSSGTGGDTALWHALAADLGCAGLLVPEDDDGAGATFREAATVAEELGRSVAPVPYLGSAVVATMALLEAGDHQLLPELARGDVTIALAAGFATAPGDAFPRTARLSAPRAGDGHGGARLRGEVRGVADALDADLLLVPADGVPHALYVVGTRSEGVRRIPVSSLDMTRPLCDVEFDDVEARLIASGSGAEDAFQLALLAGAAGLAAEQLGVAEKCLELTVAYVKERRQFARPVGSFQGLKHRLADLWVEITQARAAARYAAACLAEGNDDTPVAVALAKAHCGDVAVHAAEECVQMHGGIGFTWEHPAHLYLKRAKADSIGFGTSSHHRAALADLVNLPEA